MEEAVYHVPVLLKECVDGLVVNPAGVYADVTFGGGGHSRAIVSRLDTAGHLYSFDQDEDAEANIVADGRFTFVRSNFRYLKNWMRYYGVGELDGLLADLGVSSHHFDDAGRGFSFRFDGRLDMRMNQRAQLTAADVLNDYAEERLADIFYLYGELKNARKLASWVVKARMHRRMETTEEFMVVLTYHFLEDRMVKNLVKTGNVEGKRIQDFYGNVDCPLRAVHNKVIVPGEEEQRANPRSRSAKLRIAEKK